MNNKTNNTMAVTILLKLKSESTLKIDVIKKCKTGAERKVSPNTFIE